MSLRGQSLSPYADRCAGPTTTAFDGFLDSQIAYAVFERNRTSQVSFGYPFPNPAKEASVWLWLRLTREAEVDGIVFECQGVIRLAMNGTRVVMIMNGAERLEAQLTDDLQDMFQWNSLAISFKAGSQRIYFNGKLAAERKLSSSFSLNSGNQCRIGTGVIDSKNLISGHIRHFVISSQGLDSEQLAQTKIRSVPIHSDKNVLIYFRFDRDWKDSDSFYYKPGIKGTNVQFDISSEPETVCYCTTLTQSVLRVNRDLKLRQQNFTSQQITQLSSPDGLTLSMLFYPLRFDSPELQTSLFSISKYLDLSLFNRSQTLRVDLTVGNSSRTLTFPRFRFRSQVWSLIRVQVTRTQVILNVDDGEHVEAYAHNITKLADATPERANIPQQVNMQYLIHSVNISIANGASVWGQIFTQQRLNESQWLESGRISFQANNQMCNKADRLSPQNFISESGDTCKDSFLYPRLSGDPAALGTISGLLKLSQQTSMTLELWVKDLSVTSAFNLTSVLLHFSTGTSAPLLQLSLIPPTPSSNFTQRTLRLQPTTSTSRVLDFRPSGTSSLAIGRPTFNWHWVHLAIIGTPNSIKLVSYNLTSKTSETQSLLGTTFVPQYSEVVATIGSARGGISRFDGIIREFKVWQAARSEEEVSNYRFSSVFLQSKDILHYFRFSSGNEIYTFFDVITGRNLSTSGAFTLTTLDVDTGLTICKQGSFFNGQCCERLSLEGVGLSLSYNPSKSNIIVSITAAQGASRELLNSLVANFSLVSVGFSANGTLDSQYRRLFTQNQSGTFSVSSTLLDPLAHNLTLQARIYSLFDDRGAYMTVTQTLPLICPNFYFLINNETDVFQEDDQFIVSSSPESFLTMEVRNVQNSTSPQCYDPVKAQVFNVSVNEVRWSQQLSVPNPALSFERVWNLTLNNTLASFRQVSMVSQRWVRVSVRVTFNTMMVSDVNMNLTYSSVQPQSPLFPTSSIIRNYLTTDPITLDLSSFVSSDPLTFPQLTFRALCPRSLFSSDFDLATYCTIGSDRRFTLPPQLRASQVVSNLVYQFRFLVGVQGTNIVRGYSVNVTLYVDGTGQSPCPRVTWPSVELNKTDNRTHIIRPQAQLHCSGVFYEVISMETVIADEKTNRAITGLIFPGADSSMIYSRVPKDTLALQNLLAGSRLRVTQTLNLRQQNRTGIVLPIKTSSFSGAYVISVVKRPLEPAIFITNFKGEALNPLTIGFLETNFTLNASRSVDPDDPRSQLSYTWSCPAMITVDQCRRMQTGLRNNSLVFPMIMKLNLGMSHDMEYSFRLMVGSIDNPYATNRTISYTIKFAGPKMNDSVSDELLPTQCEKLDLSSNSFVNKGSRRVIEFTKEDWASSSVSALQTFDSLSTANRSPCGNGQVEESYLFFYLFDGNPFEQNQLKALVQQKSIPIPKLQTARINSQDYPQILSAPSDVKLQGTFYLFTKRQGSTRLFLNLESFFFERKFADLVAKFEQDQLSLDQYQTLTLNATPSYDLENSTNRNFTYSWECPRAEDAQSIPRACQTNSSILKVSYADRLALGQAQPNQNYEYNVKVRSQGRESTQASAIVSVSSQESYSECIKIVEQLSVDILSYNWQEQRVIGLQTGDQVGISYFVSPSTQCETAEIQNLIWSSSSKSQIFEVDGANKNRVNINTGQSLQANRQDDITVRVQASLGGVKTNLHTKQQSLKIISRYPLNPTIQGKTFFVNGEDDSISFTALQPGPTFPFRCIWDCPISLGGAGCFSGCLFNLTFPQLHNLSMTTTNQPLSTLFDTSLPFRVTITDPQTQQVLTLTHTAYLLDPLSSPLYGLRTCQVLPTPNSSLLQSLASDVTLTLTCAGDDDTASKLLAAYDLVWEVNGLPKETYYNQSKSVTIKAYAMSRLLEGTEVKVGVRFVKKGSGAARRMMQEYSEEQTAASAQEGEGESIDSNAAKSEEIKPDDTNAEKFEETKPVDAGSGEQNVTRNKTLIHARGNNDQEIVMEDEQEKPQNVTQSTNQSQDTTNNTRSNNLIPSFNTSVKVPEKFQKNQSDLTLTTYFQFKRPILTQGRVSVTSPRSSSLEFYTTNFTFNFSGFNTTPPTIIMFQLRGLQSPLYNTYQILIAPKLFSQQTVDTFYRSTFIPEVSELLLDWFDLSGNYLGSQELLSQPALQGLRKSGTMDFRAADRVIQALQQKVSLGYTSEGEAAKREFEMDMKRLLEVSEMLNSGLINIYGDETVVESLFQRIVQYLRANYKEMLNRHDQSNLFERRARLMLQKRLILVLYNLLQRNKAQSSQILTVIDLFLVATDKVEQLLYESGEDPQFLIGVILWMQNNFRGQLESVKLPSKSLYFDRIYNITEAVNEADIKRSSQTGQKLEQMRTQIQSRTIMKLDKASTQLLKIQNQNNATEMITFSGTEGRLAEVANISSLTVQYDTLDLSQPSTAGTLSLVTIKGFTASGQVADISFPEDGDLYFQMELNLRPATNRTLSAPARDNSTLRLGCSYFNIKMGTWDDKGMKLVAFDPKTLSLTCRAYHLTQFSAYIYKELPNTVSNNQTVKNNFTETTNQTSQNETKIPILVNETDFEENSGYYVEHRSSYGVAIGIIFSLTLGFNLVSILCCRYSNLVEDKPQPFKVQTTIMPVDAPLCQTFWATMIVFHPVVSSLWPQKFAALAIPRFIQLLQLQMHLFLVVLTSLIHLVYIEKTQISYIQGISNIASYSVIQVVSSQLLRLIFNKVKYGLYLQYAKVEVGTRKHITEGQLEGYNTQREAHQILERDSPGNITELFTQTKTIQPSQRFVDGRESSSGFDKYEGGESEGSDESNQGSVERGRPLEATMGRPIQGQNINPFEADNDHQQLASQSSEQYDLNSSLTNQDEEYKEKFGPSVLYDGKERQIKDLRKSSIMNDLTGELSFFSNTNQTTPGGPPDQNEEKVFNIQSTPFGQEYSSNLRRKDSNVDLDQIEVDLSEPDNGYGSNQGTEKPPKHAQLTPKGSDTPIDLEKARAARPSLDNLIARETPAQSLEDKILMIESDQQLKGTRILLLIIMILFLLGLELAVIIIMQKVEDLESLKAWSKVCVGVNLIQILILDTLACKLFSIIFRRCKEINSKWMIVWSAVLVSNYDVRSLISLNLELNQ